MLQINKLDNSNYLPTLQVLKQEPNYNIFFIGDIEVYGCESENVDVWNQVDDGKIAGVLLRYNSSFNVYYIDENQDSKPFAEIITSCKIPIEIVCGKMENITCFKELFPKSIVKDFYFCQMQQEIDIDKYDTNDVQMAVPSDAQKLCDLRNTIDEFSTQAVAENVADAIEKKFSRYYYIGQQDKIISMAATTAENSVSNMIVGVCTDINHRRKGYMKKVMAKLCHDLQQEGKNLCLFYDNIDAGRIYHSLGFEVIGKYALIETRSNE